MEIFDTDVSRNIKNYRLYVTGITQNKQEYLILIKVPVFRKGGSITGKAYWFVLVLCGWLLRMVA